MNALYHNRIYEVVEADCDLLLKGSDGVAVAVDYGDEELIVDPTDTEIADAVNLAEWYGVDNDAARQLRLMLLGETSLGEWYAWRAQHQQLP